MAIKFMRKQEDYIKETKTRDLMDGLGSPYIAGISLSFPSDRAVSAAVQSMVMFNDHSLSQYKYAIAMPAAEKSLESIFLSESLGLAGVKKIAFKIGECLRHLHLNGLTHGDVKMSNICRFNGRMKLIDFTASAVIKEDYSCAKFSSGVF